MPGVQQDPHKKAGGQARLPLLLRLLPVSGLQEVLHALNLQNPHSMRRHAFESREETEARPLVLARRDRKRAESLG